MLLNTPGILDPESYRTINNPDKKMNKPLVAGNLPVVAREKFSAGGLGGMFPMLADRAMQRRRDVGHGNQQVANTIQTIPQKPGGSYGIV